jgi:hypothetical protein
MAVTEEARTGHPGVLFRRDEDAWPLTAKGFVFVALGDHSVLFWWNRHVPNGGRVTFMVNTWLDGLYLVIQDIHMSLGEAITLS